MKTRKRVLEEEAKKEPDYHPTEQLEEKEVPVPDDDKRTSHFPWASVCIMGVLLLLIISCVIVIFCLGKPA